CSMADMPAKDQAEQAWEKLGEVLDTNDVTPVTYINSAASLKAFCGKHGGIVCTSSNASPALEWAFKRTKGRQVFPEQHLGRSTAKAMGVPLDEMPIWDPAAEEFGGNSEKALQSSRVLLWKGHCSVLQMFQASHVAQFREKHPGIKILVHPECPM